MNQKNKKADFSQYVENLLTGKGVMKAVERAIRASQDF